MTRARHTPVLSFGPELLTALIKGSREEVVIEGLTFKQARHMQLRLYQLRTAMRKEKHEFADLVARARVSLLFGKRANYDETPLTRYTSGENRPVDTDAPAKLILRPQDSEFRDVLAAAGIHETDFVETAPPAVKPPLELPSMDGEDDPLAAYAPHVEAGKKT